MYGKIKEHLQRELAEIEAAGLLQEGTDHRVAPAGRDRGGRPQGAELLRQQLPRTVGQPTPDRSGQAGHGPPRLRHVVRAFHLRLPGHPQGAGKGRSPTTSARRTRSSTPPASTPTAACSSRSSPRRTPSSPTHSTTPRSSTACVCARPCATVTPMPTWPNWRSVSGRRRPSGSASSAPTACSRWTATPHRSTRSAHLAEKYDALVMVDECHSAGVLGKTGRGITELYDLRGQVDILTGTLGKAFGGAVGGFTTGRKEIIDMLRQRSRPYLFSNSLPPAVVGAAIELFKMLGESDELHDRLVANVEHFRTGNARRRVRHQTHPVGHLRRDALRRQTVAGLRREAAGRGRFRHGLLLSGRAERARRASACRSPQATRPSSSTAASPPSSRSARS